MLRAAHLLDFIRGSRAPAKRRRGGRVNMSRPRRRTAGRRAGAERGPLARAPLRWGLALNLTMALVLGLGLGLLQANAGQLSAPIPPLVLALVGAGVMGLLAGLTARLILEGWTGALKFLLSLLTLLAWMAVAEATYAIWVGLQPFEYLAGADNWVEIGQLAIGCLGIMAVNLIERRTRERAPLQWIWRSGDRAPAPIVAKASLKWSLGLNLVVAVVLGLVLGFLQANASQLTVPVPPLALALAGAGVMGLLLGLAARLTLRGWTEALKFLVVLLALLVWMAVAEVTYAVWTGLRPLEYLAAADNWVEMGQLAIGCLGAIVGGLARRRTSPAEVALAPQRVRETAAPVRRTRRRRRQPAATPQRTARQPRRAARVRQRRALSLPQLKLPTRTRRRPLPVRKSSGVKVIAKAEERCPYCLDVIEKGDPRGVVVCEICGTPHHADCWEAGGKCQVPHLIT
jgi:low affinity Fe/Cu permease